MALQVHGVDQASAIAKVKSDPTNADLRIGLFRLFAITGQWDRAVTQLTTAMELKSENALYAKTFLACISCERFRSEVFAGRKSPLFIGEPPGWAALMVQALQGKSIVQKRECWDSALHQAPMRSGQLNGDPFDWIADADSNLGPLLEAFIDGKYYWIAYAELASIEYHEPGELIETVWQSAEITFSNGGTKTAYLPVRYFGSETNEDEQIVRGLKTQWDSLDEQYATGLGQRTLVTDQTESPVLECRKIEFS